MTGATGRSLVIKVFKTGVEAPIYTGSLILPASPEEVVLAITTADKDAERRLGLQYGGTGAQARQA